MAKIEMAKLVVDKYSTNEIIEFLANEIPKIRYTAEEGMAQQNLALIGVTMGNYAKVEAILYHLNEKLNGKKEPTVVQ